MKKLYPATRFVVGAILQEEKEHTELALILPPLLTEAPPTAIIERLEKSAEKAGDRVNENELAKTMLATGVVNMDDVAKYTKCFNGKVKQTQASAWNRLKVNLTANGSLYKPYPGHEGIAKFVGFKDFGETHARKTYRIHLGADGKAQYLEVGKKFTNAVSDDIAQVLSGGEALPEVVATELTQIPTPQATPVEVPAVETTPVTPVEQEAPKPSETVPTGSVDSKEVDSKDQAKQAEETAVADWMARNTDADNTNPNPVENPLEPVVDTTATVTAPEATDVSTVGLESIEQGIKDSVDEGKLTTDSEDPSKQATTDDEGGGGSIGVLLSRARSDKMQKSVEMMKAKYGDRRTIKQAVNVDVSDVADGAKQLVEIQNSKSGLDKKLEAVISDMYFKATNMRNKNLGLLLTGDPGTGKTSFIRMLSDAVGLPLITLEAPHITKEHIIQIPFLVKRPFMPEGTEYITTGKDANPNTPEMEWQIENSESNIFTQMKKASTERLTKWTDEFWLDKIETAPAIDGCFEKNPELLDFATLARKSFSCIFFVDEFFRTQDPNIRNLLRGIINGNIGSDKFPDDVYCIYAANMDNKDGSFDDVPKNMQFGGKLAFDNTPAPEWASSYFANKFDSELANARALKQRVESGEASPDDLKLYSNSKSTRALANMTVPIDTSFTTAIAIAVGEDLSKNVEEGKGLRTSPRRLEQICLALSVFKDEIGKNSLVNQKTINAFIRVQFREYSNGLVNEAVYERVAKEVAKQLGYTFDPAQVSSPSEWEDQVATQLLLKNRLGAFRSYPLMVSGEPGIGKTKIMTDVCGRVGMPMITIEATTLTKASVVGMPLSKERAKTNVATPTGMDAKAEKITIEKLRQLAAEAGLPVSEANRYMVALESGKETDFAPPSTYRFIMEQYFQFKREMMTYESDVANGVAKPRGRKRPTGQYQVMLFIDELTRVEDKSIFNVLRMLLLEHKLGDKFPLPEDLMTSGALNPEDSVNVEQLSDHTKDVLDIIPAEANWDKWFPDYLLKKADKMYDASRKGYNEALSSGMSETMAKMSNVLGVNTNNFAKITAKVLEYCADKCRIGQFVGTSDVKDATALKKKFPMIDTPSEKFFWMGMSENDTVVPINPRNMDSIFEKMVTGALIDMSIDGTMNFLLCDSLQKMQGKQRDPKLVNVYIDKVIAGYINAFETQMELQGQIQQTSETSMKTTIQNFIKTLASPDGNCRKIITAALEGEVAVVTTVSMNDYFTEFGFTRKTVKIYPIVERLKVVTTDFVKEFNDLVAMLMANGITNYIEFVNNVWLLVQSIDLAIKDAEKDDSVDIRQITEVSTGIKKSLAKTYGDLFEPMVSDEPTMTTVMTDEGFETNFIDPNLEYLKDVL